MKKQLRARKLLQRIMQITLLQTVLIGLTLTLGQAHEAHTQGLLDRAVSIKANNVELRKVLSRIEDEVSVKFVYSSTVIQPNRRVSVKADQRKLSEVLAMVLEPLDISYRVIGGQIMLTRVETSASSAPSELEVQPVTDQTVTGTVTDEGGAVLPGVNVLVKGTQRGTTTDQKGNYLLTIEDPSATLVFSFVGYEPQEVTVGNRSSIDISLRTDTKALSEVIVVGYGTVKKSDLTGSVAKVGEDNIKATPIVALDRAMQGRAAGVLVTTNSARPGGGATIRIRGTGSVNAGNEPLYVIDGFPTGDLNSINPNDIESMEILKDASATAIYGSRGSNGVVIVTTKRGKAGQSTVDVETYYGIQNVRREIPLLNAREYAEFINEARVNGGGAPYFDGSGADRPLPSALGEGTNWQKEVLRSAPIQNYQITMSGGETKTRYAISGNIYNQDGIILNSYFKRYTLRTNIDREISSWLNVGLSMQGAHTRSNSARTESGGGPSTGVTNAAVNFAPVNPVLNAQGNYFRDFGPLNGNIVDNPVGIAREITDLSYANRVLTNFFADVKILPGLTFRTTWGADLISNKYNFYVTRQIGLGANTNGRASVSAAQNISWLNENTLTYNHAFNQKHSFTALLGYTSQTYEREFFTANAINFNDDFAQFNNLQAGATLQSPGSRASNWALVSLLARVNYNFDDRFLFTLTARRDGSSRFGPTRKYGFFPSGALAWRIINEKFMKDQSVVSDLKLRASYGLSGNQEIGDYQFLSSIGVVSYAFGVPNPTLRSGSVPNGISNLDLSWETSSQLDLGVDVSFLSNRLSVSADYYIKTTSDLLFNVNVPLSTGYSSSLQNIGKVENRGFEFSLKSVNLPSSAFQWSTDLNFAFNRNEVLALDGRPAFLTGEGAGHLNVFNPIELKVGEPLGNFYGRKVEGIFQNEGEIANSAQKTAKPGDFRYADLNGDGIINDNDRTVIGNGYPTFFGGINNTFSYKGIDLTVFFQGSFGNEILNYGRFDLFNLNGNNNQSKEVLNRWTPGNPSQSIPRATTAGGQRILSDFHVEDGSYVRLKNITLGYNLPSTILKRIHTRSAKVYVSAQNYLTFTKYSGYDPEVSVYGTSSINQGMDYGGYPAAKTLLIGLNLKF